MDKNKKNILLKKAILYIFKFIKNILSFLDDFLWYNSKDNSYRDDIDFKFKKLY